MREAVEITMACGNYDRTYALHAGLVELPGVRLHCVDLPPSQIFVAATRDGQFDVAEMSLSMYLIGLDHGDDRFVALPIFPLRALRHRDIYTATHGDVMHPRDLVGRAVGMRHFHMTSAVWQRGILADDFGVAVDRVRWVRAEVDAPGPVSPRMRLDLPLSIDVVTVTSRSLVDLAESGELGAALVPAVAARGHGLRRLFQDVRAVEGAYYRRTGIYPIMHVMVVRREIAQRHPWLAAELLGGFERAKAASYVRAASAASPYLSPFYLLDLERDQAEFGDDLYPYGVPDNATALGTFARYCQNQGLTGELPPVEDWFAPMCAEPSLARISPATRPESARHNSVARRPVDD